MIFLKISHNRFAIFILFMSIRNLNAHLAHFSYLFQVAIEFGARCAEVKCLFMITFERIAFYYFYRAIGLMSRVFANGSGDRGSISGRVIPKTRQMVLYVALHYKIRIKGSGEIRGKK